MMDPRIEHLFKMPSSFNEFAKRQGMHHMMGTRTAVLNERSGKYGVSQWNNLFLDNWGKALTRILGFSSNSTFTPKNLAGVDKPMKVNFATSCFLDDDITNYQIQLGSGEIAPTLADVAIETAFATSPEDSPFTISDGSYAAGVVTISGSVTAGGTGTVNEAILICNWAIASSAESIAVIRDAISPGVSFVATDPLVATVQITI